LTTIWTFYYYAGSSRVAERVNTNGTTALYFLFTDHLGSTSVLVDSSGAVVSRQLYRAFGTPRFNSGTDLTDYGYTGQRADDSIVLMYYNARWYDPTLGRFTQADTMLPGVGNPLAWDRYAYVNNNPILLIDPTGHHICDADGYCGRDVDDYYQNMYIDQIGRYNWYLDGEWTTEELHAIFSTAATIDARVDELTNGGGMEWMRQYLGNTLFSHWGSENIGMGIPYTWVMNPGGFVLLPSNWLEADKGFGFFLTHELGHLWDGNTGQTSLIFGVRNGLADVLNELIGGNVWIFDNLPRYWPNTGNLFIPIDYRYPSQGTYRYANNSTADYFAETFALLIYHPNEIPFPDVRSWMESTIALETSRLQ
jgi:RHS repeat-associated protein